MRALTVQQPWAWAIMHGGKDVENRTQAWGYRGPLAIHAGARWSERGEQSPLMPEIHRHYTAVHFGAIIGVVDLIDVHAPTQWCSEWGEHGDVVHLVLANPRPLADPIPAKGRLGLWTPDAELLAAIREQVSA